MEGSEEAYPNTAVVINPTDIALLISYSVIIYVKQKC